MFGQLTRDQVGVSVPPTSPLYGPTPTPNIGIEALTVTFETDPAAALKVLPDVLELATPATAYMNVLHIPRSSMGEFCEASLFIGALFNGKPCRYAITMMVTNDGALCLGREMLGSPKKLGSVVIERRPEGIVGTVSRAGTRVVSAGMTLAAPVDVGKLVIAEGSSVALRMIRSPNDGKQGEVKMELIESRATWEVINQWTGPGSVQFTKMSGAGSWDLLPVCRVVGSTFGTYNVVIPEPRLMATM